MRGELHTAKLYSQADLLARVDAIVADGCPHLVCKQPARLVDWAVCIPKNPAEPPLLIVDLTCTRDHGTYGYERLR